MNVLAHKYSYQILIIIMTSIPLFLKGIIFSLILFTSIIAFKLYPLIQSGYKNINDIYFYANILVLYIFVHMFVLIIYETVKNLFTKYSTNAEKCSPVRLLINFVMGKAEYCGDEEQRVEMESRVARDMKKRENEENIKGSVTTHIFKNIMKSMTKSRFASINVVKHLTNVMFNIATTFVQAWVSLNDMLQRTIMTMLMITTHIIPVVLETAGIIVQFILDILDMLMVF